MFCNQNGLTTIVTIIIDKNRFSRKYVDKGTDKFKLEPGGNLDFKLGNDALSSGVSNPIRYIPNKLVRQSIHQIIEFVF